ncbi:hypothetical protein OG778_31610 [Streptomyces sp. NBC_00184]|uniref:hypothetical protein n=1 Tax=unclassified Streptomyces TaxID=2593676 RepID=UPI002E2B1905|nr:hypothetical protein [Streptomyces sp. NBC_00184]
MPGQATSATSRHWSDIRNGVFAPETVRCLRITLTAPGDTVWAVNEIRLYGGGPGAAATLRAEQAGDIRGVTRGDATTGFLGSVDRFGFREIRFGAGADRTAVRVAAARRGMTGVLQVRLGSPKGRIVGGVAGPVHRWRGHLAGAVGEAAAPRHRFARGACRGGRRREDGSRRPADLP